MWVAVGWSSDVIPVAKRMSNVAVVVPKSGASLWADLWVMALIIIFSFQGLMSVNGIQIHLFNDACFQFTNKLVRKFCFLLDIRH